MNGLFVQPIDELEGTLLKHQAKIAIIVVPGAVAQEITDRLVKAGIESILSYAPINLNVPPHVRVSYSDPVVQMQQMTYYVNPQKT